MMPAGSINAWKCQECGKLLVAIHRDEGVTPMFLACRPPGCGNGMGISAGYPEAPIPEHIRNAIAWEWRKASKTELKRWRREEPGMYEHCRQGGLVLAPLSIATPSDSERGS